MLVARYRAMDTGHMRHRMARIRRPNRASRSIRSRTRRRMSRARGSRTRRMKIKRGQGRRNSSSRSQGSPTRSNFMVKQRCVGPKTDTFGTFRGTRTFQHLRRRTRNGPANRSSNSGPHRTHNFRIRTMTIRSRTSGQTRRGRNGGTNGGHIGRTFFSVGTFLDN